MCGRQVEGHYFCGAVVIAAKKKISAFANVDMFACSGSASPLTSLLQA